MNDIEKAIFKLKKSFFTVEDASQDAEIEKAINAGFINCSADEIKQNGLELQETFNIAIKALEKQLPKDFIYDELGFARCGSCKSYVDEEESYCRRCGQKFS